MSLGAAAIMAGANILGGIMQNKAAKSASARQMAFQKDMSDTSYQRAVADMRAAGINPLLAYSQGGASTPAGSTYSPVNVGAAGSQGYLQGASSSKTLADIGLTEAKISETAAKIGLTNEQKTKIAQETESIIQTREFQEVLHGERFMRLFATMSSENVAASVIAVLNRVDIEHVLKGLGMNKDENLRNFLTDVQKFRSFISRETKGALSVLDMARLFLKGKGNAALERLEKERKEFKWQNPLTW